MSKTPTSRLTRRNIFAGAGTAGALAAAAVVLPLARTAQQPPAAPGAGAGVDDKGGYQVTDHVLRYYQTARV